MFAGMFWLGTRFEVAPVGLAGGVLAAGLLQLVLLWPALGRLGLRPRLRLGFGHAEVRKVGRLMLPTLFYSSVAQVNLLVGPAFAALPGVGGVGWPEYYHCLVEFRSVIFGGALGTVALPTLTRGPA